MTVFQAPLAQPEPVRVKPANTNVTTLVAAQSYKQAIGKIRLVNETSGAVTANVDVYNGTTAYSLTGTVSIAANSSLEIYDEILNVDELLRITAGAGASLVAHVIFSLGAQR